MAQSNLQVSDRKSLRQLIIEQNAVLQQINNPNTGKSFFICGNIRGYISPRAAEKLRDPESTVDDFRFAMVAKPGEEAIPCLMVTGNLDPTANVMRTLGDNLLH